jgi:hypothetical protein
MFGFRNKNKKTTIQKPSIMGLEVGTSFDVDTLGFNIVMDKLTIASIAKTQIITAAGKADMDGNTVFRFYTDDEAWLQVVCEGGETEEHIIDVKLFHYYNTESVDTEASWNTLLHTKIGTENYTVENNNFSRVWSSVDSYAMPVGLQETTYDESDDPDITDQFIMLFEREVDDHNMEFLFLSAEETENEQGNLDRCFVLSTGVNLTPSQITVNG